MTFGALHRAPNRLYVDNNHIWRLKVLAVFVTIPYALSVYFRMHCGIWHLLWTWWHIAHHCCLFIWPLIFSRWFISGVASSCVASKSRQEGICTGITLFHVNEYCIMYCRLEPRVSLFINYEVEMFFFVFSTYNKDLMYFLNPITRVYSNTNIFDSWRLDLFIFN